MKNIASGSAGRNKRVSSDTCAAVLMIAGGITGFVVMSILGIAEIFLNRTDNTVRRVFLSFAVGIAFAAVLITIGIKVLMQISRWKRLSQIIIRFCPNRDRVSISLLAGQRNQELAEFSRDLCRMTGRGYFPGAVIDMENKELVFDPACPPAEGDEVSKGTMYKASRKICWTPFVLALLAWAAAAQVFTLTELTGYLVSAVVTIITFILAMHRFPAYKIFSMVPRPPEKAPAVNTGDVSMDKAVSGTLEEIVRLERTIRGTVVRECAAELIRLCREIFSYVGRHPEKQRQIKQFAGYYLPFAVNLMKSYAELEAQPEKGDNIIGSMSKIESTMPVIVSVARREYDMLFFDKAMDISADIAVLKNMLEQIQQ